MIADDCKGNMSESLAAKAAHLIAEQILGGEIDAGSPLVMRELIARTGLRATPLREGVTRLLARGLVKVVDQKGFFVIDADAASLDDYFAVRWLVEETAMRNSIANGTAEWRERVAGALAGFLGFTAQKKERPASASLRLSVLHKAVHTELVSNCGSPRLMRCLDILQDQEILYCHNLVGREARLTALERIHTPRDHQALVKFALEGDADRAGEALAADHRRLKVGLLGPASS